MAKFFQRILFILISIGWAPLVQAAQAPCGTTPIRIHERGGGKIAVTAQVDPLSFVAKDSVICGRATIIGSVVIREGSYISGSAYIVGRGGTSTILGSRITEYSRVVNSTVRNSIMTGSASLYKSSLEFSTLKDQARALNYSVIMNSKLEDQVKADNAVVLNSSLSGELYLLAQRRDRIVNKRSTAPL